MKLKKIASLALAGIMAVSMLAGCGTQNGGSSDNGNTVVEPTASGIAKVFNDTQTKIAFVSDSTLDTQLAQAVKKLGENAAWATIEPQLKALTGKTSDTLATAADEATIKNGQTLTSWEGKDLKSSAYWTEADAINAVARDVNDAIAQMDADTDEDTPDQGKYYSFSYTGTVAVVSVKNADGSTTYHVVYTISQTAAEQTKTKG